MAKERRVKFEFNPTHFVNVAVSDVNTRADITEERKSVPQPQLAAPAESAKLVDSLDSLTNSTTDDNVASTTISGKNLDDSTAFLDDFELSGQLMQEPQTTSEAVFPETNQSNPVPPLDLDQTRNSGGQANNFGFNEPPSPRMLELLLPKEPRTEQEKHNFTMQARQNVVDEAYNRCLTELEKQALNDEYTRQKMLERENNWRNEDLIKKKAAEKFKEELQQHLDQQIHEFEKRKEQARIDRVNSKVDTIIKENSDGKLVHIKKEELCNILMKQMEHKEADKRREKEKNIAEEREYLDHVAIELDLQNASDRANHLSKQSVLLEAWEREGHIKNLKKLQASGINAVHGYIRTNLLEGTPDVLRKSGSQTLNYSARSDVSSGIGFDARKSARK